MYRFNVRAPPQSCGNGLVAIFALAAFSVAVFSLSAVLLGLWHYSRVADPRRGRRFAELIALAFPLAAVTFSVIALFAHYA